VLDAEVDELADAGANAAQHCPSQGGAFLVYDEELHRTVGNAPATHLSSCPHFKEVKTEAN
jgi:hypothetical protein